MKTPYLDSQLKGYRKLAESGKMPEGGMEQLKELEAIKEALNCSCSLEQIQSLRKVYKERFYVCAKNENYREAHEENIRVGVMDLLISKSSNL
jgi:hypothetical protein